MIIEVTSFKSKIVFAPLPQDDPVPRQPDISRAREPLGWQPTVPLQDGLARTIGRFESRLIEGPAVRSRRRGKRAGIFLRRSALCREPGFP
jgi:UDP-glucuronate decarboxylase